MAWVRVGLPFLVGIFMWGTLLRLAYSRDDLLPGMLIFGGVLATVNLIGAVGQAFKAGRGRAGDALNSAER